MRGGGVKRVLVLGGTSEIATAIVRRLGEGGATSVVLVGRDPARLAATEQVLQASAGSVQTRLLDATHLAEHRSTLEAVFASGPVDVVILAVGELGPPGVPADLERAVELLDLNFMACASLLLHAAALLGSHGGGTVVVLSSVAAERPRASLAIYGAAKAGLDALAQAMSDALRGTNVRILVVRPGFVSTRMTAGLARPPLSTTAESVARASVAALEGNAHTVWVPGRLRWVMAILRHLPRAIFRRLPI